MKADELISDYFKKSYKNIRFARDVSCRVFHKDELIAFGCDFKGTANPLPYQDKMTTVLRDCIANWNTSLVVFKVIDFTDDTVTLREVNPFTGKFYRASKEIVCPKWTAACISGSKALKTRGGDIVPAGPWEIYQTVEKCWLPSDSYNGVHLDGGCHYMGYVEDIYKGAIDVTRWNNGKMIADYAVVSAPEKIRTEPWKFHKRVQKKVVYTVE